MDVNHYKQNPMKEYIDLNLLSKLERIRKQCHTSVNLSVVHYENGELYVYHRLWQWKWIWNNFFNTRTPEKLIAMI